VDKSFGGALQISGAEIKFLAMNPTNPRLASPKSYGQGRQNRLLEPLTVQFPELEGLTSS
jgi:hypothetical protein